MPQRITPSVTLRVPLQAFLSSDHVSPATGKTIAITISKNGAAYGNPSGGGTNATEIASGSYYVDLSTTDTGTAGPLFVLGTCSGVDNVVAIYDVGYVGVNVLQLLGAAWLTPGTAGTPDVNVKLINAVSTSPVTTIKAVQGLTTADTVATATAVTTVNGLAANVITASSIAAAALNGKGDWALVGSNMGTVTSVSGAVGSVTGNVGGNVVGSVASVTAAVAVTGDLSATMKASVTTAATAATPTVTISTGTGAGQLQIASGVVQSNTVKYLSATPPSLTTNSNYPSGLQEILATGLSESSTGYLAAAFKKFLNVASPALTVASVNQTGDYFSTSMGSKYNNLACVQALKLILCATVGPVSGMSTGSPVFTTPDGSQNAVSGTATTDGRSSITLNP